MDLYVLKRAMCKYKTIKQEIESNIPALIPKFVQQQCRSDDVFDIDEVKSTSATNLTLQFLSDLTKTTEITQEVREFVAKIVSGMLKFSLFWC